MQRIFATRPLQQNQAWANKLRERGYNVVEAPLLAINPVQDQQLAIAKTKVLNLDEYQKLIFVSQNAVDFGVKAIDDFWPQLPLGPQWFTVGRRTAQLLEQALKRLFDHSVNIVSASHVMNSEELLASDELQSVADEKILIFRGSGGRPLLAEELEKRGALVHYCELYERAQPKDTQRVLQQARISGSDIVPVFSVESLENFVSLVKAENNPLAYDLQLVVPGDRVAKAATNFGFKYVHIALNATEQNMLKVIDTLLLE